MDTTSKAACPKPRVYIETTIPSFYFEIRKEPEMVARRLWTRRWWDEEPVELVPWEEVDS